MIEQGERAISSWRGDNESQDSVIEKDAHGHRHRTVVKTKKGGVMVLTNRRLVWLEERGVFGKSYHPQMNLPLESLKGLSMGGAILKYVSVTGAEGELVFHLHGVTNDSLFNSFKQTIMSQVSARRQEVEAEKRRDRVHIMMDFSFLKSYMEKGGLAVTTIKCNNCAAPMKMPESGESVVCSSCGQTNYVQDIFEKVKALIG